MKLASILVLTTLLACASIDRASRDEIRAAIFEFVAGPTGTLEEFRLESVINADQTPSWVAISDAWLKTACVMMVLDGLEPTYSEGEEPASNWIYFVYRSDRPDRVYRDLSSGGSSSNPSVLVRPEILSESGTAEDGSAVCDGELRPPAA